MEFFKEHSIAIVTIAISVAALWVAVVNSRRSKEHNRLSVKPYISSWHHLDEGYMYFDFSVSNKGLGTAKIIRSYFTWRGKQISEKQLRETIGNHVDKQMQIHISEMDSTTALSKDETLSIIKLHYLKGDKPNDKVCKSSLKTATEHFEDNLNYIVAYESMYGETKTYEAEMKIN
jgi:hypothetical protein